MENSQNFVFPISHLPVWFQVEFDTVCWCQFQRWLWRPQIQMMQFVLAPIGDLRSLIQWQASIWHFHQRNHLPQLRFLWRRSITGWIIVKISTIFHPALLALGICYSALRNCDRPLSSSWKTRVLQLLQLPLQFKGYSTILGYSSMYSWLCECIMFEILDSTIEAWLLSIVHLNLFVLKVQDVL